MSSQRIMIVEDEAIAGQTLFEKLADKGYEPHGPMRSGEMAIEKAAELLPDLILMDINLASDMDGIEAATEIRKKHNIPVVYLTAFSDEAILARAKLTTPHSYLIKPVRDRELFITVELTLERNRLERALREHAFELQKAKDEWERTFESVRDLIGIFGPDRKLLRCNAALAARMGVPKDKLRGRTFFEVFYLPEDTPEECPYARYLVTGESSSGEVSLPESDETFVMTVSGLRDQDGEPAGVVCSCHNISDRKRAEDQLRRRKEDRENFSRVMLSRESRLTDMIEDANRKVRRLQQLIEANGSVAGGELD